MLSAQMEAVALYAEARSYCASVGDFSSKYVFESLINDEQGHIDFLETQIELHDAIGARNHGQLNAAPANDAGY